MNSTDMARPTSLMWLMDGIAPIVPTDAQVAGLSVDSRAVMRGGLFFALPGTQSHGVAFAIDAVRKGASIVLWEPGPGIELPPLPDGVYCAPVHGLSSLIGRIADRFYGWPSANLRIVGITGTNGKTTCAYLLAQCLGILGGDAAYIGTLGVGRIGALDPTGHTTPDAVSLHRQLAKLRAAGVRTVAMEVSSHALAQDRIAAVRLHTAAFTNLSRDHLDYHGSMQDYAESKARLFCIQDLQRIVINVGDVFGRDLAQRCAGRDVTAVWIGESSSAWMAPNTLYAAKVNSTPAGVELTLAGTLGTGTVRTHLIGRFNAENALIVIAVLLALDVELKDAIAALEKCTAPPGRMEAVTAGHSRPLAIIDYAHTPDALCKALTAVREHCRGEVWCVFGCGGDRDPGKRPLMGAIADEFADRLIVTDDNPRTEEPARIALAIVTGIKNHEARIIHDRSRAIGAALNEAAPADVVLVAGKGHEEYQIYGQARLPFSDRREIERHFGMAA
jgi:UDP-N-acetylmuramoyl-L-alanyl-D-glutamate--2,6-diaminopimelate ligase